jgi:hypothetical protein
MTEFVKDTTLEIKTVKYHAKLLSDPPGLYIQSESLLAKSPVEFETIGNGIVSVDVLPRQVDSKGVAYEFDGWTDLDNKSISSRHVRVKENGAQFVAKFKSFKIAKAAPGEIPAPPNTLVLGYYRFCKVIWSKRPDAEVLVEVTSIGPFQPLEDAVWTYTLVNSTIADMVWRGVQLGDRCYARVSYVKNNVQGDVSPYATGMSKLASQHLPECAETTCIPHVAILDDFTADTVLEMNLYGNSREIFSSPLSRLVSPSGLLLVPDFFKPWETKLKIGFSDDDKSRFDLSTFEYFQMNVLVPDNGDFTLSIEGKDASGDHFLESTRRVNLRSYTKGERDVSVLIPIRDVTTIPTGAQKLVLSDFVGSQESYKFLSILLVRKCEQQRAIKAPRRLGKRQLCQPRDDLVVENFADARSVFTDKVNAMNLTHQFGSFKKMELTSSMLEVTSEAPNTYFTTQLARPGSAAAIPEWFTHLEFTVILPPNTNIEVKMLKLENLTSPRILNEDSSFSNGAVKLLTFAQAPFDGVREQNIAIPLTAFNFPANEFWAIRFDFGSNVISNEAPNSSVTYRLGTIRFTSKCPPVPPVIASSLGSGLNGTMRAGQVTQCDETLIEDFSTTSGSVPPSTSKLGLTLATLRRSTVSNEELSVPVENNSSNWLMIEMSKAGMCPPQFDYVSHLAFDIRLPRQFNPKFLHVIVTRKEKTTCTAYLDETIVPIDKYVKLGITDKQTVQIPKADLGINRYWQNLMFTFTEGTSTPYILDNIKLLKDCKDVVPPVHAPDVTPTPTPSPSPLPTPPGITCNQDLVGYLPSIMGTKLISRLGGDFRVPPSASVAHDKLMLFASPGDDVFFALSPPTVPHLDISGYSHLAVEISVPLNSKADLNVQWRNQMGAIETASIDLTRYFHPDDSTKTIYVDLNELVQILGVHLKSVVSLSLSRFTVSSTIIIKKLQLCRVPALPPGYICSRKVIDDFNTPNPVDSLAEGIPRRNGIGSPLIAWPQSFKHYMGVFYFLAVPPTFFATTVATKTSFFDATTTPYFRFQVAGPKGGSFAISFDVATPDSPRSYFDADLLANAMSNTLNSAAYVALDGLNQPLRQVTIDLSPVLNPSMISMIAGVRFWGFAVHGVYAFDNIEFVSASCM